MDNLLDRINSEIEKLNLKQEPANLYAPVKYCLEGKGKRIRPQLCLLACKMFNGNIEDAIPAAISLEMFHNFTLIHDDIMDKAPLRRGKETVYKKWNADIAILSGDTLFALAYEKAIKTSDKYLRSVLGIFTKAAIDVCEGQQFDMDFEKRDDVSIKEYIEMINLKTAALIGACLKAGAVTGSASDQNANYIYEFGKYLGIAFQLKDDFLDVFGDEKVFGKQNSGDIVTNKKTFLFLKALEIADKQEQLALINHFNSTPENPENKIKEVKRIYSRLNIKEITEKEIDKYYNLAIQNFEKINIVNDFQGEILQLAKNLMLRQY